ncbi:unnamed protein product [Clonostachys rhizophaga]|uniref:Uncharacterized protein n=1 Tax=Clonostachys rhizophaga TaxID=160324 RepID=A0A9N9VAT9_9HYPO|nr:unnamed protein product [Clonostachys rhizophaga]
MQLGSSYGPGPIDSAFTNAVTGAATEFQDTFPDNSGFRFALVEQCLRLRESLPSTAKSVKVIDLGLSFLILALTISHGTTYEISGGGLAHLESLPPETQRALDQTIRFKADLYLSVLLERSLGRLLSSIEDYLKHPQREEWAATCFTICLLLMGAESLQVDMYINGTNPDADVNAMEGGVIKPLVGLFQESTSGLNPLLIDWSKEQNVDFLRGYPVIQYALADLHELTLDYVYS